MIVASSCVNYETMKKKQKKTGRVSIDHNVFIYKFIKTVNSKN